MKFKYPKIAVFVAVIIAAYVVFTNPPITALVSSLSNSKGYFAIFIAGILYSFGFTAPFATGFFATLNPSNVFLAAAVGGFGSLFADLSILKFVRLSFKDEFEMLKNEKFIKSIGNFLKNTLGKKITSFFTYLLAAVIIASPLPDETGVSLLAGLTEIKENIFSIISFCLKSIGILIILSL